MMSGSSRTACFRRDLPILHIDVDLALIDHRLFVGEHIFDRIFDGEDVHRLALVDVIEHAGDRCRFAGAGDAREDDHALIVMAQLFNRRRQVQAGKGGNLVVDAAGHQRPLAALPQHVDAKAAFILADHMSEVGAAGLFKRAAMALAHDRHQQPFHVLLRQRRHVHFLDQTAMPHHRRQAGLQMQVRALVLHHGAKQLVHFRFAFHLGGRSQINFKGFISSGHACPS